ncbi:DNA-deoxyinosine glycosylase [Silvimonas iriomotensis]|uniref:DNA-deoxyinosine glycosylase n=1 Tax=Silvimonas iriomotensis TaxID=449662 RepID=A0ABQ2P6Z1_9NEIS|nr:DNA-deoxyinosine glycosylase [Silvimonas iriomotensis]GGP19681.1 DNA-deoxyinosine glycosylase [Silvimonas iriomotensis]
MTPHLPDMDLKRCFPPVVNPQTRLLILGSLPGEASLAQQQYYAHPQNRFWELLGSVIGVDLRAQPYAQRLDTLLAHGVGLWDVIAQAERKGSLDAAIRNHAHNALTDLIATLPALRAVAFNGGTSARIGRKQLQVAQGLQLIDLPSSSPAYTLAFAQKLNVWSALAAVL